ncbi:CRTAC1 family protein [Paraglaciecola sp.]|uniref:CRTAC1 family protein n=1 Tax=Paraglaciecola sp. TaxID=1920173 RepID=UPI003EF401AA
MLVCLSLIIVSCGGGSSSTQPTTTTKVEVLPPVTPPLPPAEPEEDLTFGGGFSELLDSNIAFQYGYISPESNVDETGNMPEHPEAFAGGAALGDYDGDGDLDVFIVRGDLGGNLLYQNDGEGVFVEVAAQAGLKFTRSDTDNYRHSGPSFADLDGDGDLDLFIGGINGDPSLIFQNQGNGIFYDVTATSGLHSLQSEFTLSSAFGDFDKDGDLDMFLTHWGSEIDVENPRESEHLWRNDSNNTQIKFTDVSAATGVTQALLKQPQNSALGEDHDYTFTPNFADINNDGYADLLVVADFGLTRVLLNKQDGTFEDVTDDEVIIDDSGMGAAIADYDNDGDLDWFVSAITGTFWQIGNRFYQNESGTFSDNSVLAAVNPSFGQAQARSSWGWGACAADLNNDGNLDIYMSNGFTFSYQDANIDFDFETDTTRVFMGLGDNTFEESAALLGLDDRQSSRAILCADFDNDGDIDLLQLHRNEDNAVSFYRNDIGQNNWLAISLSQPLLKNKQAIGARVYVTTENKTQMREVNLGSHFTSQTAVKQIFGLGQNMQASLVRIVWPDGSETVQTDLVANQHLTISKSE